jgi:hypothetical protein
VITEQRHAELAEVLTAALHPKHGAGADADVEAAPFSVNTQPERLHTTASLPGQAAASGLSTPIRVSPFCGTRLTSRRNASRTSSRSR